jgi:hypothetical protein
MAKAISGQGMSFALLLTQALRFFSKVLFDGVDLFEAATFA